MIVSDTEEENATLEMSAVQLHTADKAQHFARFKGMAAQEYKMQDVECVLRHLQSD